MKIQLFAHKPDPIVFGKRTQNITPKTKVEKPSDKKGLNLKG
jgi:hypothetical protein